MKSSCENSPLAKNVMICHLQVTINGISMISFETSEF